MTNTIITAVYFLIAIIGLLVWPEGFHPFKDTIVFLVVAVIGIVLLVVTIESGNNNPYSLIRGLTGRKAS